MRLHRAGVAANDGAGERLGDAPHLEVPQRPLKERQVEALGGLGGDARLACQPAGHCGEGHGVVRDDDGGGVIPRLLRGIDHQRLHAQPLCQLAARRDGDRIPLEHREGCLESLGGVGIPASVCSG